MINVTFKESSNKNNQSVSLSNVTKAPIVIEEQLDASLDSGTLNYLKSELPNSELNEALAGYTIDIDYEDDGKTEHKKFDFVGMDSRALLRKVTNGSSIYLHQVSLTEPSKLLQGVMIDGFGVSQPEDYNSRKTLHEVVNRLLTVTPFDGPRFTLTKDENVVDALQSVKSPEFKWNTQTTLWECLLQVGAVIDAMPRLVANINGNYTVVTFDFVNAYVGKVNSIDDDKTNAFGENVNESQYNTALSAIVENLREN